MQKKKAIGVILSGGGTDGIKGAKEIGEYGGTVIAQRADTAQFPFMPGALITSDHPAYVLAPTQIAIKIQEHVKNREAV